MKNHVRRFFSIFGMNTLLAICISIGSMILSVNLDLKIDFPLTIIGIAVVFPIVFSIGGAYNRRETALSNYGLMKSMGRCMYFASRDWLRDDGQKAAQNIQAFRDQITNIFSLCIDYFQSPKGKDFSEQELRIYKEFSFVSKSIEELRDRGLSGSEVSRVNGYLSKCMTAFENIKHIYQYRTPRALRLYSKLFIFVILIVLGPYFALLSEGLEWWIGLVTPILFAMVFTGLDNIQEHLENPFDQIGEDDIRMNPEKFKGTLC